MTENRRTEDARAHDDSAIIEEAETGPAQSGVSGGIKARVIGSRAEEAEAKGEVGVTRERKKDKELGANPYGMPSKP